MTEPSLDPYTHVARLATIFDSLHVEWVLGGSLASSIVGEPRSTVDIDLATNLTADTGRQLVDRLGNDYYVDPAAVADAVAQHRSFNIIHYSSATKIDIFVLGDAVLDHRQLAGRVRADVELVDGSMVEVWVGSPIDQALRKLSWYREGGEISDRQLRDVVSILAQQGAALDRDEFVRVATSLGFGGLARQAISAAGPATA